MANKEYVDLPSLSNVAAGNRATLSLPVGLTYHRIFFTLDGPTLAELTNLEILINGKVVQTFSDFQRLDDLNDYWGRGTWDSGNGHITLWFDRAEMEQFGQKEVTAIGTGDVQTFTIRFNIDSGATVNSI
ncbi:MAG TPA: major capsid protein P2, partial [Gammaproteobacteria bacterium]|nr:major capsid protein P2 [Gammaproteobacteria bacterium]